MSKEYSTSNMNDESAPLTTATFLYGTTEPETVTFDENTVPRATATIDDAQPHTIGASLSGDQSTEFSQGPELPVYRDVPFSIIFCIQLLSMIVLGFTVAPAGYDMLDFEEIKQEIRNDPTTSESDFEQFEEFIQFAGRYIRVYPERILFYLLYPTSFLAFFIALVVVAMILRPHAKLMVQGCLIGAFVDTAILLIFMCIQSQSVAMVLASCVLLAIVAYYVGSAWRLVPYTAVNLEVALEGIRSNCGIYIVAFALAKIGFLYIFFWFYTCVGVMIYVGETRCPGIEGSHDDDDCAPQGWAFLFLLLSFYWTIQVIINTIQVTVAGVMASWCYVFDEAQSCCSPAVWSSLLRSLTFSFGSICFGSLLHGIVRVLRCFIENLRKQRDDGGVNRGGGGAGMIYACFDCLVQCFDSLLEYFNHWAFVFCAIYGESYLSSGRMVIELFKARGWMTIITDDLIGYVLAFTTFSVGILTGLCSMLLEITIDAYIIPDTSEAEQAQATTQEIADAWKSSKSFLFGPLPGPYLWAFGTGFIIGLIVCSVMMSVVRGAVNTLIVCWADSPSRLETNHPDATKKMAEAWTIVFPQAGVQRVNSSGIIPVNIPAPSTNHLPSAGAYNSTVMASAYSNTVT